jgi:ankyrin repeat protein
MNDNNLFITAIDLMKNNDTKQALENIKKMSDVNFTPHHGNFNILFKAIYYGCIDIVSYLIPICKIDAYEIDDLNIFHVAANFDPEILLLLLKYLDYENYINKKDKRGYTPLHYSVPLGRKKCVSLFLDYGADPNIPNNDNKTPLDIAKEWDYIDYIEITQMLEDHIKIQEQINNSAKSARLKK